MADPENTWLRVDGKIVSVQGTGGIEIYEIQTDGSLAEKHRYNNPFVIAHDVFDIEG